jgi:serine/threonine-protein kinase RsbW
MSAMTAANGLTGVIGLRVPGSLVYRHLAIRFVTTACKMALEAAEEPVDFEPEVVSAFGEAFNNVAVHSYRDAEPQPIHIEVDWDAEKLVITMIDTGRTFDPATVAPPELEELPESGMGLFIMTACMDVVDYQPGPPNVLRMVKLRQREGLLPPAPSGAERPRDEAAGALAAGCTGASPGGADTQTPGGMDDDRMVGDRGSGVDEIVAAVDSSTPPGDAAGSVWRMKAVRAPEAKREISRRR